MQKFKYPLIIFLLGVLANIFGAWAKITHQPIADIFLPIGMLAQAFGVAWAVLILLRKK